MTPVFIVQQQRTADHQEVHDSLDSNWFEFLFRANILPIIVPNNSTILEALIALDIAKGVILTGGGEHSLTGNDARSEIEKILLMWATENKLPVLGVCRGMQAMILTAGGQLEQVKGHVCQQQSIDFLGKNQQVNSYHKLGCYEIPAPYQIIAKADDGVVKAIQHQSKPWLGIMWHPERMQPFRTQDLELFNQLINENILCRD